MDTIQSNYPLIWRSSQVQSIYFQKLRANDKSRWHPSSKNEWENQKFVFHLISNCAFLRSSCTSSKVDKKPTQFNCKKKNLFRRPSKADVSNSLILEVEGKVEGKGETLAFWVTVYCSSSLAQHSLFFLGFLRVP